MVECGTTYYERPWVALKDLRPAGPDEAMPRPYTQHIHPLLAEFLDS
jgi:hypothetical protein